MATQSNHSEIAEAMADRLAAWERQVITDHELSVLLCRSASGAIERGLYEAALERLQTFRLISPSKDFPPGTVFHLFGRSKPSAMEVACAVDPFAYLSHLSAMEFHGITDHFSRILYLTTPAEKEWKALAQQRMEKELGKKQVAHRSARLPVLRPLAADRIEGMRIESVRRSHRGAFKAVQSPAIRVAMIGRTFLDMLREPERCGGMQHVVDTYRDYGARYLPLITQEVEVHGKAIDKSRAGFLLEEVCKLDHPLIEGWKATAQRGGSRLLDPGSEYAPFYSEAWKLSINVPSLIQDGATGGGTA